MKNNENLDLYQLLHNLIFDFTLCSGVLNSIYIIRNVRLVDFTDGILSLGTKPSLRLSNCWLEARKSQKSLKFIENLIQIKDFVKLVVLLQEFGHHRVGLVPSDNISSVKSIKRTFLMI